MGIGEQRKVLKAGPHANQNAKKFTICTRANEIAGIGEKIAKTFTVACWTSVAFLLKLALDTNQQ